MSFYGKGGVSADFVGLARKRRQADTPSVLQMYASGCSGNVTAGKYNDGDPANRPSSPIGSTRRWRPRGKPRRSTPIKEVAFRSVPLTLEARSSAGFSEDELTEAIEGRPEAVRAVPRGAGAELEEAGATPASRSTLPVLDFGGPFGASLLFCRPRVTSSSSSPRRSCGRRSSVLVAGYGECGPGYIPIERAWKEKDGNLSDWCWVNPGSEKRMLDALEKVLS